MEQQDDTKVGKIGCIRSIKELRKMVSFTLGHVNGVNKDESGTKNKFESRSGIKLRALASHQCGPSSIPGVG